MEKGDQLWIGESVITIHTLHIENAGILYSFDTENSSNLAPIL